MKNENCHYCDEPYEVCPGGADCTSEDPVDWRNRSLTAENELRRLLEVVERKMEIMKGTNAYHSQSGVQLQEAIKRAKAFARK